MAIATVSAVVRVGDELLHFVKGQPEPVAKAKRAPAPVAAPEPAPEPKPEPKPAPKAKPKGKSKYKAKVEPEPKIEDQDDLAFFTEAELEAATAPDED